MSRTLDVAAPMLARQHALVLARQLMAAVLLGPPGTVAPHRAAAALVGAGGVGGLEEAKPEVARYKHVIRELQVCVALASRPRGGR